MGVSSWFQTLTSINSVSFCLRLVFSVSASFLSLSLSLPRYFCLHIFFSLCLFLTKYCNKTKKSHYLTIKAACMHVDTGCAHRTETSLFTRIYVELIHRRCYVHYFFSIPSHHSFAVINCISIVINLRNNAFNDNNLDRIIEILPIFKVPWTKNILISSHWNFNMCSWLDQLLL